MQKAITVFLLTFSILTALILPLSALIPSAEDMAIYDSVIRLHVLANSDSDADQTLKLAVRDGILSIVSELMSEVTDKNAAEAVLRENLHLIESAAASIIERSGNNYTVSVTLTKEKYPARQYENVTLPAGEYTSLRVLIGEAEGRNWWCVLFPKLCVGAKTYGTAVAVDEDALEAGLTPSQIRLITGSTPDVVVKFRLVEFFKEIFS